MCMPLPVAIYVYGDQCKRVDEYETPSAAAAENDEDDWILIVNKYLDTDYIWKHSVSKT